jgi:sodium transport system permease protein
MTSLRWPLVWTLLRHELRLLVRDRRTIVFSVLLPLAVMPFILFINVYMEERREAKLEATTYSYAVTGSAADMARSLISAARATHEDPDAAGGDEPTRLKLQEEVVDDPAAALEAGELHLIVSSLTAEEAAARPADDEADASPAAEETLAGSSEAMSEPVPVIEIAFRGDRESSSSGASKLADLLADERQRRRQLLLVDHGLASAQEQIGAVSTTDVASQAEVTGAGLGKFVTALAILFILTGGSIIATDSIAGEKERGTLETLLTTAVGRTEIVTGKLLSILAVALIITVIQVANLLVYVGFGVIPTPESFALEVTWLSAALMLITLLPATALVAAVLLLTSGIARTYKEAQLYFFPVFMVGLVLSMAAVLPGIELSSAIVIVPLANTSVAIRELLIGTFNWPFLIVSWIVTGAAAVAVVRRVLVSLSTERLISPSESDSGLGTPFERFAQAVPLFFALIWVVIFVAATNIEAVQSLERQVLLNVVLLMGAGSILLIRRFGLDLREALAMRAPRPSAWVATALGAPAGLVTGIGLFRLANLVIPVPEQMLRSMSEGIAPADKPLWLLLIFVALLPGIFEEVAFRGALLHGLHRRLRPVSLCLVVAVVFALFHMSLYRIVPTLFLGILLAAATLLTGSIYPAMVWHGLNNAVAISAGRVELPIAELPPWAYVVSAAILALCFWILYRDRTPYPGLRPMRSGGPTSVDAMSHAETPSRRE